MTFIRTVDEFRGGTRKLRKRFDGPPNKGRAENGETPAHGDQSGGFLPGVHGSVERRHCEPADKTRTLPHFNFDFVSASKVGRLLDGVLIAGTIELEHAQYLAVSSEEIDSVRGLTFH
jgi:hypothetical protein